MSDPAFTEAGAHLGDAQSAEMVGGGQMPADTVADETRVTPRVASAQAGGVAPEPSSLIADLNKFRRRWESIQVGFVDDPRRTVDEAAALISDVVGELTAGLQREISALAAVEDQGSQTEAMRQTFTRYRDFFDRLLVAYP